MPNERSFPKPPHLLRIIIFESPGVRDRFPADRRIVFGYTIEKPETRRMTDKRMVPATLRR
jgi:hypothetical protein